MCIVKIPNVKHGLCCIDGQIMEAEIKEILIQKVDGFVERTLKVVCSGGEKIVNVKDFFQDIASLRNDRHVECDYSVYIRHWFGNINITNDEGDFNYFVIENGRAVKKNGKIENLVVYLYDDDSKGMVSNVESSDVPKDAYISMEQCYSFNDISIIHDDGRRETIVGAANLCKLTPIQQELVDQLVALHKKADELGIEFVVDYNGTYVFNKNNIKSFEYNYEAPGDSEMVDLTAPCFRLPTDFATVTSEDDNLYIERKQS